MAGIPAMRLARGAAYASTGGGTPFALECEQQRRGGAQKSKEQQMITYFQDGGYGMFLILIAALASVAVAVARKGSARSRALWLGSYACMVCGVFGMATGMMAVSAHVGHFADKGAAVAQGLGELSNNGTFAAACATLLGIAALALTPKVAPV